MKIRDLVIYTSSKYRLSNNSSFVQLYQRKFNNPRSNMKLFEQTYWLKRWNHETKSFSSSESKKL